MLWTSGGHSYPVDQVALELSFHFEVTMAKGHHYLDGAAIDPQPVTGQMTVAELVEQSFLAYNAARLREACQLFVEKMLADDVTIGMSLTGALTPAGLGMSAIIPLIENGFVDWIVS